MDTDALERMIERGQDGAMLRFTLGNARLREERWVEAAEHYERAVGFDPAYSAAWQALVRAQLRAGLDEATVRDSCERGLAAAREQGDMQVVRTLEARLRKLGGRAGGA